MRGCWKRIPKVLPKRSRYKNLVFYEITAGLCDADARLVAVISELLTTFVTPQGKLVIFKYTFFFRSGIVMVTWWYQIFFMSIMLLIGGRHRYRSSCRELFRAWRGKCYRFDDTVDFVRQGHRFSTTTWNLLGSRNVCCFLTSAPRLKYRTLPRRPMIPVAMVWWISNFKLDSDPVMTQANLQ